MRARRWMAGGSERGGLETLLSGRSGARKGDGFDDDERNADHGSHGSSLRRGFPRQAVSRGSSRIYLAGALFAGYEGGSVDGIPVWPNIQRVKQILKKCGH